MNTVKIGTVATAALGSTMGLTTPLLIKKMTGKPIGAKGSLAHVITNDKIEHKGRCLVEMTKEGLKDEAKILGGTALAASATSLIVGNSNKAAKSFKNMMSNIGTKLSKVSVSGKNLKDVIKNSSAYTKFSALPTPAKAAIAAGAVVLTALTSILTITSASKAGYIEAQHETKVAPKNN